MIELIAQGFGVRTIFVWQPVPTYKYDLRYHFFFRSNRRLRHIWPKRVRLSTSWKICVRKGSWGLTCCGWPTCNRKSGRFLVEQIPARSPIFEEVCCTDVRFSVGNRWVVTLSLEPMHHPHVRLPSIRAKALSSGCLFQRWAILAVDAQGPWKARD